ncbi:MAG TPA: bifunctional riboflavin kinase/FAD synthetase [Usitatibacter sp.]|nr:bifunctional riboflavin kinase/FAD synthetase [Usitatibacter sp.]
MRVVRHPAGRVPETAIAIGSFDGLHRGHQQLLARVADEADARALTPAVITFEPLPREFFNPAAAPARLSSLGEKLAALPATGMEIAYVQRFTRAFAALEPADFAQRLRERHGVRWIIVGEDFRYGARRAGDLDSLRRSGRALGFEVAVLPAVADGAERISSTRVRAALAAGQLADAAKLLGRPYSICGRVMHGAKRGRELGFPTANVRLGRPKAALAGIFAVKCFGAATRGLEGVASLGINPAVQQGGPATLEAFLFDFSGDLYGRRLTIEFVKKLRDEAHFASLDELAAQIQRDCDHARSVFRAPATGEGS